MLNSQDELEDYQRITFNSICHMSENPANNLDASVAQTRFFFLVLSKQTIMGKRNNVQNLYPNEDTF